MPTLNLLVLRCKNIKTSKEFYEKLGFSFVEEQHNGGVIHYSTTFNGIVLELYPLKEGKEIENIRLGFSLGVESVEEFLEKQDVAIVSRYEFNGEEVLVLVDPDGRKIEIKEFLIPIHPKTARELLKSLTFKLFFYK